MKPEITFYPVGNGDMTLIKLESSRRILIDINIRQPNDDIRDVAADLRKDLGVDEDGRPYVDVMVLSHPDQDHCRGFEEHFHVGPVASYRDNDNPKKIIIREMWSSALVFRRASKNHTLCQDAKVWNTEARRRANLYKKNRSVGSHGDLLLIMGEDEDGKTDDIPDIVKKVGDRITSFCGLTEANFSAFLLAPLQSRDALEEELLGKNDSSIVMNYSIGAGKVPEAVKFLSGGDAVVGVWEKIWETHGEDKARLQYNLLSAPHHCSWRSLSWDSWKDLGRKAKVSVTARNALSQALPGAMIVASAKEIKNDNDDPPCYRAKEEYDAILKPESVSGQFWNTGVYVAVDQQIPLIFEVSEGGLKVIKRGSGNSMSGAFSAGGGMLSSAPLHHG